MNTIKTLPYTPTPRYAFTLIELSIVLVIIGLIIGGILVGRDLIRSSELRSVTADVTSFEAESSAFRLKYKGLPGDIYNATSFFGAGAGDGNGNSRIDYLFGAPGEEYTVWQHLSAAQMVDGTFDGTPTSLPESALTGGMYRMSYQTNVYGISGNMISYNAMNTEYNLAHNAILTPQEAYSVDVKLDDGLADSGRVLGFNPEGVPGCVTNYHSAASGSYILTNDEVLCKLFFRVDF